MILIPSENAKPVKRFFDSLNDVILKIIDIIMSCAHMVFALLASLIVEAPNIDLLKAYYYISTLLADFIVIFVYLLFVKIFKKKFKRFY